MIGRDARTVNIEVETRFLNELLAVVKAAPQTGIATKVQRILKATIDKIHQECDECGEPYFDAGLIPDALRAEFDGRPLCWDCAKKVTRNLLEEIEGEEDRVQGNKYALDRTQESDGLYLGHER